MKNKLESQRNHALAQSLIETGVGVVAIAEMLGFALYAGLVDMSFYPGVFAMMLTGYVAINRATKNVNTAKRLEKKLSLSQNSS